MLAACSAPEQAPDLGYTLLDGRTTRLAALRGQVVLLRFWATNCTICVHEMPALVALDARFRDQGLATLAVAMPYDAPAAVADFAQSRHLPFGVVIDNTGEFAHRFGDVQATPTTVLIDRRGRIVRRDVGAPDPAAFERSVAALIAEPA